jgi:aspartate aminotransferase
MTVGAAGPINVVLKTIVDPGDEIVVFAPFFGEYRWYAGNVNANFVVIPNTSEDFTPDIALLERALTPRTKAVIINTPNNPSGAVYGEEVIKKIAGVLESHAKKTGSPVYLISDEPYREIVYDDITVPYVTKYYKDTFVAYSYSKSLSIPGERVGYLAVPSEMTDYTEIWQGLSAANRVLGFVNSPSLFQWAVMECADVTVDMTLYRENRDILYGGLTRIGYECFKPPGAFYLFPKSPIADDAAFCEAAKEYNLLIVPGKAFGVPGHFRIAYCVKKETVQNSLDAFEKAYNNIK